MKPQDLPRRPRTAAGLTELETDLMQVLWSRKTATAAEVRDALARTRPLAHTTVITLLDRLCDKGAAALVPGEDKAYRYRPVLRRETVANRLLRNVRQRFFDGSSATLLAHLIAEGEVDARELAEIRRLLDRPARRPDARRE